MGGWVKKKLGMNDVIYDAINVAMTECALSRRVSKMHFNHKMAFYSRNRKTHKILNFRVYFHSRQNWKLVKSNKYSHLE